nr:unnamed protein product [Haemonchus contortus]
MHNRHMNPAKNQKSFIQLIIALYQYTSSRLKGSFVRSLVTFQPTSLFFSLHVHELSLVTTFPTETDNCEGQMIFVKLRSMLLFLGVLAIAVESIKIKVGTPMDLQH